MEVQCSKLNLKKTDVAQVQADGAMGLRIGQVEKHKSNFAQRAKLIEKRTSTCQRRDNLSEIDIPKIG